MTATLSRHRSVAWLALFATILALSPLATSAQPPEAVPQDAPRDESADGPQLPAAVEVAPAAKDNDIRERLQKIYAATGWFSDTDVEVRDGVVFLRGQTEEEKYQAWAEQLALNTEGVVAVVNQLEVETPSAWDFSPAREEFNRLLRGIIRALPIVAIALFVLSLAWFAARGIRFVVHGFLRHRVKSQILREVAARSLGLIALVLGLYFVLRVAGLSRLAVTVIGGTGLVGLVLGIAFRDITENFLASLFLSLQNPFRNGDLVEIDDTLGLVERLTSRTTILTTLDGNQVQIPNAKVFKSVIRNFNSNPNRRDDFLIGIGYDDSIPHAQEVALRVLNDHPAVLDDPEPWVLVDSLGEATVNLRVYFWLNADEHSFFKVRSSVIRLVKRALQDASVSMPDAAREIVFPAGVPVRMLDDLPAKPGAERSSAKQPATESEALVTAGEQNLTSEAPNLKQLGRQGWSPEGGENLLEGNEAQP